jgi:putative DNA primase/helicase
MGDVVSIPQKIEIQPDNIPEELKSKDKWLLWRWEVTKGRDKPTKPPYRLDGKRADVTDPESWAPFQKALNRLLKVGKYHGVGFCLSTSDGIVAWDLDHCINQRTAEVEPWAMAIVQSLNSYTEVTPSGEGLRVFLLGTLPEDGRKKGNIEAYVNKRYITVTGAHLPGTPKALNTSNDEVWLKVFKADKPEIKKAKQGKNTNLLVEGKWEEAGYPSQSEADLAFCQYLAEECEGDAEKIDAIFRESKLYRDKWDKPHFGDGTTYGAATIGKAIQSYDSRFRLTDLGNARRFARLIKEEVRYCISHWYIWDGKRLEEDRRQKIYLLAYRVIKELIDEAKELKDDEQRKKRIGHAMKLESRSQLESMIKLTEHQPEIAIVPEDLDKNHEYFNCTNGIITPTGEIIPHSFEHMITKLSPVDYNPTSEAPVWEKFLTDIIPQENVLSYLQRAVGYSMTGLVTEQALFFLYGKGKNGKSTFLNALKRVFGDYFTSLPVDLLMAKHNDQHPTFLTDLRGARFVLASEPDEGRRFNEGLLKQITGGEPIKARRMRENSIEFESTAKLWIMGNHRPIIRGTDYAIWRRIHLIPFTVTITKEAQDKMLWSKLEGELEGILNWCVKGYLDWKRQGLNPPQEVIAATEEYRAEMDIIQDFLNEETVEHKGMWTLHADMYARYAGTSKDKNERLLSSKAFAQKLREKGIKDERRSANQLYWANIVLKTNKEEPEKQREM